MPAATLNQDQERQTAWMLAFLVLAVLTLVKPLGGIPYLGPVAFTGAALLQLWLPLHRIDALGLDYDWIGLTFKTWKKDLRLVLVLIALTFPVYAVLHYLFMTQGYNWATELELWELRKLLPRRELHLHLPPDLSGWLGGTWWFLELAATHGLGVALPEETFYRGYLQPRLQSKWPPTWRFWGVSMGWAAVVSCGLFALGHFLGEWNPLRLGPFIPGLVFAWQRNATGSVVGAIGYHACCNVISEVLSTQYRAG